MNDDDSLLERELARLAPRGPSDEFKARLSAELTAQPEEPVQPVHPVQSARQGPMFRTAVGIAAALALAALVMVGWPRRSAEPERDIVSQASSSREIAALDKSAPSIWNYRRAVLEPGVDLDELLDRQRPATSQPQAATLGPFSVSSLYQQSRLGDL